MPRLRVSSVPLACLLAVALSLLPPTAIPAHAQMPPAWRDTGIAMQTRPALQCFDRAQPGLFHTSEYILPVTTAPRATYANNYRTGERTVVASRGFDACDPATGALFTLNGDGSIALHFTAADPAGTVLSHFPNRITADGGVYYSFGGTNSYDTGQDYPPEIKPAAPGRLFVSTDSGQTWQERGAQFAGRIAQIVPLDAGDGRGLYALAPPTRPEDTRPMIVWFSPDVGETWETRVTDTVGCDPRIGNGGNRALFAIPNSMTIGLTITPTGLGPHAVSAVCTSADGGNSFFLVGTRRYGTTAPAANVSLHGTSAGILRLGYISGTGYTVAISSMGGTTFVPVTAFADPAPASVQAMTDTSYTNQRIIVAPTAPNVVLFGGNTGSPLALSQDGGRTWEPYGTARDAMTITPTMPPVVLGYDGTRLVALDLPVTMP